MQFSTFFVVLYPNLDNLLGQNQTFGTCDECQIFHIYDIFTHLLCGISLNRNISPFFYESGIGTGLELELRTQFILCLMNCHGDRNIEEYIKWNFTTQVILTHLTPCIPHCNWIIVCRRYSDPFGVYSYQLPHGMSYERHSLNCVCTTWITIFKK